MAAISTIDNLLASTIESGGLGITMMRRGPLS